MAKPSSPKHPGAAATSSALTRLRELATAAKQPTARPAAKPKAEKATAKAEKATAKAEKATAKAKKATAKAEKATAKAKKATAVTPVGEAHTPTAAPELSTGAGVLSRVSAMLARVPSEHIAAPEQPVPHLISEALALQAVARRYADKLGKIGFSEAMLDGLQLYAQALHEAQAQLDLLRGKHITQAEQKTYVQASELRSQLLLGGRLVLRKDRKALEALDAIAEGDGLADLARDLLDLALVVESYSVQLERLGLGLQTAIKARELAKKLTEKLNAQKPKTDAERAAEELRNRAATVLQELIAEARLGGAYLFRKEPRVALLFTATHLPRRRGSR